MTFGARASRTAELTFEVGFAVALRKPVWAYRSSDATLAQRIEAAVTEDDAAYCQRGYLIEDFGLSVNLMVACSARLVAGGPAVCLDAIKGAGWEGVPGFGGWGLAKR